MKNFMPKAVDYSSMWWAQGYPTVVEGAAWDRCIESGYYRFILNTESLDQVGLGPVATKFVDLPKTDLDLGITIDGKTYHCIGSEPATRFTGPRLIEAGKFVQRADVTGLKFADDQGNPLNVEARFETIAWPDRLGLTLFARPGQLPIVAGDGSFGRINGGFGLDGTNRLVIPADDCPTPAEFTIECWVFAPEGFDAGKHSPWLFCKNQNEESDGNYGLMLRNDGSAQARLNIGGGSENAHVLDAQSVLRIDEWNHLALSYDGRNLRLYSNGRIHGEVKVGKAYIPKPGNLTFGDRGDQPGGVFAFRGVVDQIKIYDRALNRDEFKGLRRHSEKPPSGRGAVRSWEFRKDVQASSNLPRAVWNKAKISLGLKHSGKSSGPNATAEQAPNLSGATWREVGLVIDPLTLRSLSTDPVVVVKATEIADGRSCPVSYDRVASRHRIDLDGTRPVAPKGQSSPTNDALERVRIELSNPTDQAQVARLLFEKNQFRQGIGSPITGVSVILRDLEGNPTGIPVQLSKNWHRHPSGGEYQGQWLHALSLVHLPAKAKIELELTMAYGHWGGLPAASHAQLSLIGWGGNQRWDQSALGSWGESVCYEPEQVQASCAITDMRPMMVSGSSRNPKWRWTTNVGGGDFFRAFDPNGNRLGHAGMQADYLRYGPCLTEVMYRGQIAQTGIRHHETVSIARSDDLVCATYRIRMDVDKPTDLSRLAIFQVGSDRYNPTREKKFAVGNFAGLINEWDAQWGGNTYRGNPIEIRDRLPWASLHEAEPSAQYSATANRGMVIREWKAVLGGKPAHPWLAERGIDRGLGGKSSILEVIPPPGVTQFLAGDYVEATIQHLIVPQRASDYYGPNDTHRAALKEAGDSWRMIHRQVNGDDLQVKATVGAVQRSFPDVRVSVVDDRAAFAMTNGIGYVPITFVGLNSHSGYSLLIDGKPFDQSMHGRDFWQCDFDARTATWSRTYNIPASFQKTQQVVLQPAAASP